MDELVRQGAQALIIPTMDVIAWGPGEHALHSLVAPTRAAEYGLPIVRIASSGISQIVDKQGSIQATAPFPGQEASLAGTLMMAGPGHLPIDRFLGPAAVLLSALFPLWFWFARKSAGSKLHFDDRKE